MEWYVPRGRVSRYTPDFARLSKDYLKFSKDAWKKYFGNKEFLKLGYDEKSNSIGLLPTSDTGIGLKVGTIKGVCYVSWGTFVTKFNLYFDKTCDVKMSEPNKFSMVVTLPLSGCIRKPV
jgi:hypothetical protein